LTATIRARRVWSELGDANVHRERSAASFTPEGFGAGTERLHHPVTATPSPHLAPALTAGREQGSPRGCGIVVRRGRPPGAWVRADRPVRRHTMTTEKARKRATRERMTKTGERYAAARPTPPRSCRPASRTGHDPTPIRKGTGSTWDDGSASSTTGRHAADAPRHRARLHDEQACRLVSQTVTVGYERARGMRARHETTPASSQRAKTVAAPADRIDGRSRRHGTEPLAGRGARSRPDASRAPSTIMRQASRLRRPGDRV